MYTMLCKHDILKIDSMISAETDALTNSTEISLLNFCRDFNMDLFSSFKCQNSLSGSYEWIQCESICYSYVWMAPDKSLPPTVTHCEVIGRQVDDKLVFLGTKNIFYHWLTSTEVWWRGFLLYHLCGSFRLTHNE